MFDERSLKTDRRSEIRPLLLGIFRAPDLSSRTADLIQHLLRIF